MDGVVVGVSGVGGKVRKGGKVRNLGETFAHLDFGVFSAWELGKVRKCGEMCVYTV